MLKSCELEHAVAGTSSAQYSAQPSLNANPWFVEAHDVEECERRYQKRALSKVKCALSPSS